jgi:hypothetical protein
LRPRSSNPPEIEDALESIPPSIPPDAIVPASSGDEVVVAAPLPHPVAPVEVPVEEDVSLEPPLAARPAESERARAPAPSEPRIGPPDERERPSYGREALKFLALLVIGLGIGTALRGKPSTWWLPFTHVRGPNASVRATPSRTAAAPSPSYTALDTRPSSAPSAAADHSDEIPPEADVPPGYGMLEVTSPPSARVRIDGAVAAPGPVITRALPPGLHEVRIQEGDRESRHVIDVRSGKMARVPPPGP